LYGGDFKNVVSVTANGELKFQKDGSTITLFEQTGFDTVGKGMGLSGGASTAGAVNNTKMADLLKDFNLGGDGFWDFEGLGGVPITINGVSVMVTKEDTVGTFMAKLNGSEAGVTLSYTASTNSFTLTSKLEGTANAIKLENPITQFFFGAAFGMDENTRTEAQNFKGTINGVEYVRQSNSFTHEGMTFTFNKVFDASADPIKIEVSKNTSEIVTGIKAFVEEYNKLVTHINDLLKGKRDRDYPPLTDDDRKAMKDEEIKLYEEKAKGGLLANDAQLRKLLNDMRAALYQKVEGVGLTMADIGITTSPNYMDGGTLVIDENKLSAALDKNYDGVVSLFTKSSSIPAWEKDSSKLAKRASESGIAQRLNDILTAAAGTSTTGDKGYLLQKAGAVNDRTQYDNSITKQVNEYDKKIDQLLEKWYRQENTYYMMFARMETAMSKLQAQQNSLAQIMAQSGK
jgi:flagellar hook-associated protein 2